MCRRLKKHILHTIILLFSFCTDTQTPSVREKHWTPPPSLRKLENVISQSVSNWEPTSWWALTGHKGKKAPGLLVTRPVISHGIAGAHSEAGIAGPPLYCAFPTQALPLSSGRGQLASISSRLRSTIFTTDKPKGMRMTPSHGCHHHRAPWLCLMEEQVRFGEYDGSDKNNGHHYLYDMYCV